MATKIESQNKQIKAWLESGKSLTPLEAINLFNSLRLGARVFDLKNDYGMNIKTEMVEEYGKRYAKYSLEKDEEQDMHEKPQKLFHVLPTYADVKDNDRLKDDLN